VHKAQGVTVDRAYVLATLHMDRHAAYVGLTRHRDGVALYYAAEDFTDPVRLARALGRERAKDTTLDYGGEDDPVRRYAERRGLDMLRPESEIVVQASVLQPEATLAPASRRSRFAGFRLDASRPAELPAPVLTPPLPAPARVPPERERQRAELEGLAADYARAWLDAERMRQAALPVLPHQEQALMMAGRGLDGFGAGASRDMQAALDAGPGLAEGAWTPAGMQALLTAMGGMRRDRLALEGRGREAVRAWDGLEQAYEAAGQRYAWDEQREAGTRLEAFAQELKRDPQLDGLLRERGRELGIEAGSRLDRVVQAPEVDGRLLRSVDIEHGP